VCSSKQLKRGQGWGEKKGRDSKRTAKREGIEDNFSPLLMAFSCKDFVEYSLEQKGWGEGKGGKSIVHAEKGETNTEPKHTSLSQNIPHRKKKRGGIWMSGILLGTSWSEYTQERWRN
jgi:hypothetical protein